MRSGGFVVNRTPWSLPPADDQPLSAAVAVLAAGGMVVVADDRNREDEADLVMPAAAVTTSQMAFFLGWGSGIVCTPMSAERAEALALPQMVENNTDAHGTAFTVTVDAAADTSTGVSAADRTTTVHALAAAHTTPGRLRRPGHVFPLIARAGGVLVRAGHRETAVDLTTMAGLSGVGVIGEITDEGAMLETCG